MNLLIGDLVLKQAERRDHAAQVQRAGFQAASQDFVLGEC
jgi:hypothetical protein